MSRVYRIFFGKSLGLLALLVLASAAPVWANGFQLFNELSARSMGVGAAMTAREGVAESAWFNPAAVAFMNKSEVVAGAGVVMPSLSYDPDGPGHGDSVKQKGYELPYVYMAGPLADRIGVSLSVNVPYGLTTEWDRHWPGRYYALKTELRTIFVTPSVSYRVTDWLSFGAGAQLVRGEAELTNIIHTDAADVGNKIDGVDSSAGYTVSAMVRPFDKWSLGAVYRSEVKLNLTGTAKYTNTPGLLAFAFPKSNVDLALRLPATVSLGVATTAVKNLTLSADAVWTDWSSYESLTFHYDMAPGAMAPGVVSIPKKWHDAWAFRFGAEYQLTPAWILRASYVYDKTPVNDHYRDPSLPVNDRHLFGAGVGYVRGNLGIDAAYTYIKDEDSRTSQVTPLLSGSYEGHANVVNLNLRWMF